MMAIEVGKRLREVLKKKNMSIAELSRIINVHYDTVCKWVRGDRLLKGENLKKVVEVLKVSMDYLYGTTVTIQDHPDNFFPHYHEVMSLPPHKRFDKIVEIAKQETGCPLVVFDSELRERYARGEVSEQEVYENIKRHMEAVRDAIKKVDGDS